MDGENLRNTARKIRYGGRGKDILADRLSMLLMLDTSPFRFVFCLKDVRYELYHKQAAAQQAVQEILKRSFNDYFRLFNRKIFNNCQNHVRDGV
jgi:hypothetical protein